MAAGTLFCLIFILLFGFCGVEKNMEAEKIPAEVGQDVTLPCKVPNNKILITAVEWSRPEMDPEYVLFYRDGRLHPENQHPSYQNRVDLQDKEMKDGNFSLILKNVMKNDTGRYECRVFEEGKNEPISIINLVVYLPAQTNIGAEKIKAVLGQDVILPCKVSNTNKTITAVVWIRPDREPDGVLLYQDGQFDPHNQHPSYQNQVDLQDKDMKNRNFSLILKNVTKNDTGRYECWVYQRSKFEIINIINLEVHGDQDGNTGDGGNKTGIIVVSVVGGIVLLAVVGGFLIYRYRKQNPHLPVPPDDPAAIAM